MGHIRISIIMATFNRSPVLVGRTLPAFLDQSLPRENYEIIVVDDGSTDDTAIKVKELIQGAGANIRFITQKNEGPASARNKGLAIAGGDVILFVGDDTYPTDRTFLEQRCRAHAGLKDNVGILGYTPWDPEASNDFMRWMERINIQFEYDYLPDNSEIEWKYGYTSNLSFSGLFLRRTGVRFNEAFTKAAGEDMDFCFRLAKDHGMVLRYESRHKLLHHHVYTTSEYRRRNIHYAVGKLQMKKLNPECYPHLYTTSKVKRGIKFVVGAILTKLGIYNRIELIFKLPEFVSKLIHFSLIQYEESRANSAAKA